MGSLSLACHRSIHRSLLRLMRYCCFLAVVSVLLQVEVRMDTVGVKKNNVEVEELSESEEEEEKVLSSLLSSVE